MPASLKHLGAVATLGLVLACSGGAGPGVSKVSVLLTDAPGDVLEAVVTIDQIYLQGGDGEGEAGGGRLILMDEPVTVDLLTLVDNWMPLVEGVDIPAGTYGQLRFVISGAYLKVEEADGERIYATAPDYAGLPQGAEVAGTLMTPGFSQSGLKVSFPGGLTVEDEVALLVDFDVAESFGHQAGQSGSWVMHPVLKGSIVEPEAVP